MLANLPRYATGARIVGHQHQVTTGQADVGGQGCSFGASFLLVDLDDHFLAGAQRIADVDATPLVMNFAAGLGEILRCHFF